MLQGDLMSLRNVFDGKRTDIPKAQSCICPCVRGVCIDRQWNSSILSRIKNSWWNAKRCYVTNGLKARKPATTSVLNARCSIGPRNTDPPGAKEDTIKQNWPWSTGNAWSLQVWPGRRRDMATDGTSTVVLCRRKVQAAAPKELGCRPGNECTTQSLDHAPLEHASVV